jgi:lipopolysaccharide biosynthesis glycosyltransferase
MSSVVYCTDKNYFKYFIISLHSFLKYNNPNKIYLLTNFDLSRSESDYLYKKIENIYNVQVNIHNIILDIGNFFPISDHISVATYFRLYIPLIIKEDTVLFIDSDTLLTGSMEQFTFNLNDSYANVVNHSLSSSQLSYNSKLNSNYYFNAGVIFFNLKKIKQKNSFEMVDDIIRNEVIQFWDQDILNLIFKNNVNYLDEKFNYFETQKCNKLPTLIHFTGSLKPWHIFSNHPYKYNYLIYIIKHGLTIPICEFLMLKKIMKKLLSYV